MSATRLHYKALPDDKGTVAVLALVRPEAANAFSAALIAEMTEALAEIAGRTDVRALVLRGEGKHFSAGADLGWMKESAKLTLDQNLRDASKLLDLFEALANLPVPTIGLVHGSAFGGAVGLAAACDITLAGSSAKFCLSEVRLGLLPAVILPYLARKMHPGALRRLALTARPFGADEALQNGLAQRVVDDAQLSAAAVEELGWIVQGSSEAHAELKRLHKRVVEDGLRQGGHTAETIAQIRISPAAQAGLAAFFEKKSAPWVVPSLAGWSLDA